VCGGMLLLHLYQKFNLPLVWLISDQYQSLQFFSRFTERLVMRDYFLPAILMNVVLINLHIKLLEALLLL